MTSQNAISIPTVGSEASQERTAETDQGNQSRGSHYADRYESGSFWGRAEAVYKPLPENYSHSSSRLRFPTSWVALCLWFEDSCFSLMLISFSSVVIWRKLITKCHGIIHNGLDISSLTKISDGYTMGHMLQACEQVLTERRISQLSKKPLLSTEFIGPLSRIDPVYTEEEEAFKVSWLRPVGLSSSSERMVTLTGWRILRKMRKFKAL